MPGQEYPFRMTTTSQPFTLTHKDRANSTR